MVVVLAAIPSCDDGRDPDPAGRSTTPGTVPSPSLVALDGRPSAVAFDRATGVLWVADDEAGILHRLSADGGEVTAPAVRVSPQPIALDVADGLVWVTDPDGTLTRLDAETGAPAGPPIAVGGVLVDVVADGDRVWVADIEASAVRSIEVATGTVSGAIRVPAGVVRMAVAGPRLWVTGLESEVTPIDRATGAVGDPVPVGTGPIGLAIDDRGSVWVANSDDASVSRLDADDGSPQGGPFAVGPAPIELVVAGDGVWVLDQDGPSVTHLDVRSGSGIGAAVDLPFRPRGFVATDDALWVVGVDPSGAVRVEI